MPDRPSAAPQGTSAGPPKRPVVASIIHASEPPCMSWCLSLTDRRIALILCLGEASAARHIDAGQVDTAQFPPDDQADIHHLRTSARLVSGLHTQHRRPLAEVFATKERHKQCGSAVSYASKI